MTGKQRTWFARLRRDRVLFVLVAALLLVFNTAAASHMHAEAVEIICTLEGPASSQTPDRAGPDCPVSIISASCLGGPAVPGPQTTIAARPHRPGERLSPPRLANLLEQHERHRLGLIRAPPVT